MEWVGWRERRGEREREMIVSSEAAELQHPASSSQDDAAKQYHNFTPSKKQKEMSGGQRQ